MWWFAQSDWGERGAVGEISVSWVSAGILFVTGETEYIADTNGSLYGNCIFVVFS